MKISRTAAVAALVLGMIGVALIGGAAAGTKPAIFVANSRDVTAYPIDSRGNVAPIALTTDMAAPSGIARDASGRIYATNAATNTVTVYAATSNGNVPPLAVIGGSKTRLAGPSAIALDARGNIYVLNRNHQGITVYPQLGVLTAGTTIFNEAPVAAISGSKTLLDDPIGIALDSQNKIYVANELGGPKVPHERSDRGRVTVYPTGSSGNVAPIATIRGAGTGLAFPVGIAVDSSGNIYVANLATAGTSTNGGSITVYPADSNGNASPSAIIAGDNTGLLDPRGIALDSSGNLYVPVVVSCTGLCGGTTFAVNVYAAGSNGNVLPSAAIAGADTGLAGPDGLALDSLGNLYVSNSTGGPSQGGSVTVYAAGSISDAVPSATITSNVTGLPFATGVALDSIGNLYVSNPLGIAGENGAVDIYPVGSYATGAPSAKIEGADTGLRIPTKIATDSDGNVYVLNVGSVVTTYAAGSIGDATPMSTLNVGVGERSFATGMAVGPGGKLYVASQCTQRPCLDGGSGNVAVYRAGSDGDAKPSSVIAGPNTQLANPSAVAADHSGSILVTNEGPTKCTRKHGASCCFPSGAGSVTVYAPGSSGDVMPVATIAGSNTGLRIPYGVSLDSEGNIYVLNATGFVGICEVIIPNERTANTDHSAGSVAAAGVESVLDDPILIFAAGSKGNVAPIGGIGGPYTGLFGPAGIAIGPGAP